MKIDDYGHASTDEWKNLGVAQSVKAPIFMGWDAYTTSIEPRQGLRGRSCSVCMSRHCGRHIPLTTYAKVYIVTDKAK